MNFATLVLIAATLVLRSGERISVEGPVTERRGIVIFRSGGALYSMPASEVDERATRLENEAADAAAKGLPRRLKVSPAERERLLRQLEQNHSGKPPAEQRWLTDPPPPPSRAELADEKAEEWNWRRRAREHEESVRQAKENLDLLLDRVDRLRAEIRGLLSLGWTPQNFTYQTTQLAFAEEQIPSADLAIARAQRVYEQFREDARRQGIMPGWLR